MSLASNLFKGLGILIVAGGIGFSLSNHNDLTHAVEDSRSSIASIKSELKDEQSRKPTVKSVESSSVLALRKIDAYLKLDDQLFQIDNAAQKSEVQTKKRNTLLSEMKEMAVSGDKVVGSIRPLGLSNWKPIVHYGGQDAYGRVSLAVDLVNEKGELMDTILVYYSKSSDKLSAFNHYYTRAGMDAKKAVQMKVDGGN